MAYVNAENQNWNIDEDLQFETVYNLEGGVDALTTGIADYFLWEKFTTKPYVDNDTFRCIAEVPTPWPCFVIAARQEFIDYHSEVLKKTLATINKVSCDFKTIPEIEQMIAHRYGLQLDDVYEWLGLTNWSQEPIAESTVNEVQSQLFSLKIIRKTANYKTIVNLK